MSTCSDCEYYEAINGKGYCKIQHPDISSTQAGGAAVWPVVQGDSNACGEFEGIA